MNLADALVPKYYQDNDRIINQGDPGDGMYFVEEGIVNVLVTSETGEQIKVCVNLGVGFCLITLSNPQTPQTLRNSNSTNSLRLIMFELVKLKC